MVYANSKFDDTCYYKERYEDAKDICEKRNARICTKPELEHNCAAGSGCLQHDFNLVWASESTSRHWVTCGERGGCEGHPILESDDRLHAVRCCSDTSMQQWKKNEDCDQSVWARSIFEGKCFLKVNYQSAKEICAASNGRLCSMQELESNCAADSGCRLDKEFIWSSS